MSALANTFKEFMTGNPYSPSSIFAGSGVSDLGDDTINFASLNSHFNQGVIEKATTRDIP